MRSTFGTFSCLSFDHFMSAPLEICSVVRMFPLIVSTAWSDMCIWGKIVCVILHWRLLQTLCRQMLLMWCAPRATPCSWWHGAFQSVNPHEKSHQLDIFFTFTQSILVFNCMEGRDCALSTSGRFISTKQVPCYILQMIQSALALGIFNGFTSMVNPLF